jgi:hypothetical protein
MRPLSPQPPASQETASGKALQRRAGSRDFPHEQIHGVRHCVHCVTPLRGIDRLQKLLGLWARRRRRGWRGFHPHFPVQRPPFSHCSAGEWDGGSDLSGESVCGSAVEQYICDREQSCRMGASPVAATRHVLKSRNLSGYEASVKKGKF